MKKLKLISLLCVFAMLVGCFAMFPTFAVDAPTTVDAEGNGTGDIDTPYLLYQSNFEDYYTNFGSKYYNKHVKMMENITVNSGKATDWEKGENLPAEGVLGLWTGPMGDCTVALAGSFDGNGWEISGVCVIGEEGNGNDGPWRRIGLFAGITNSGTVKNLKLVNSYFEANACSASNYDEAAAIAPRFNGTISNCYVDAIIVNNDLGTTEMATGGIAGRVNGASTITNCVFAGSVTSNGSHRTGGIVGWAASAVTISNCVNAGKVTSNATATGAEFRVGGIVGHNGNASTKISDCLNVGEVASTNLYAGAILGNMTVTTTITDCINMSDKITGAQGTPSNLYAGGYNATIVVNGFYRVSGFGKESYSSGGSFDSVATNGSGSGEWNITVLDISALLNDTTILPDWDREAGKLPDPIKDDAATADVDEDVFDISLGTIAGKLTADMLGLTTTGEIHSIRISSKNPGLRFETIVDSDMIANILAIEGAEVTYTTYITAAGYLTGDTPLVTTFTKEGLGTNKYLTATATDLLRKKDADGYSAFAGSITQIKDTSMDFIAVGCLNLTVDGQTYTIYADWDISEVANVKGIAELAMADATGTNSFTTKYGTEVTNSPYSQAQYECIEELAQ